MLALDDSRAIMCWRIAQINSAVASRLEGLNRYVPFRLQKIADEFFEVLS